MVNRRLLKARPALSMPGQDKGVPSRAASSEWKIGAEDCRGTSWSKELDGKDIRGALGGERDLELSDIAAS